MASLAGIAEISAQNNQLTGGHNEVLGKFQQALVSFDASHNALAGELGYLGNMASLLHLNLSFNALNGSLPSGPTGDDGLGALSRPTQVTNVSSSVR